MFPKVKIEDLYKYLFISFWKHSVAKIEIVEKVQARVNRIEQ